MLCRCRAENCRAAGGGRQAALAATTVGEPALQGVSNACADAECCADAALEGIALLAAAECFLGSDANENAAPVPLRDAAALLDSDACCLDGEGYESGDVFLPEVYRAGRRRVLCHFQVGGCSAAGSGGILRWW